MFVNVLKATSYATGKLEDKVLRFPTIYGLAISNNIKQLYLAILISRSFQKRPIKNIDRFMVTLIDLELTLAHCTTWQLYDRPNRDGEIDAGLSNDITIECAYIGGWGAFKPLK